MFGGVDEAFVVNVAEAVAIGHPRRGTRIDFEGERGTWPDTGVNIQVMEPGQPACRYHSEPVQEDFLVLFGECRVILEGEERRLRQWDFVHCPAGTEHVFVGAGDGPSAVLMIGSRREDRPTTRSTSWRAPVRRLRAERDRRPRRGLRGLGGGASAPVPNPWKRLLGGAGKGREPGDPARSDGS